MNIALIATFCRFDIVLRSFSTYNGNVTTAISVATLKAALAYQNAGRLMHLESHPVASQKTCMGTQESRQTMELASPYMETMPMSTIVTILVLWIMMNRSS